MIALIAIFEVLNASVALKMFFIGPLAATKPMKLLEV